jgi:small subunit ribosomal protein S20
MERIQFQEARLANLKSAIKRIRSNERKRVQNRIIRTRARSAVGTAKTATKETKAAAIKMAIRELDKAAAKGVIHKNNAARRKSRLLRELNAMTSPATKAPATKAPAAKAPAAKAPAAKESAKKKEPAKKKA